MTIGIIRAATDDIHEQAPIDHVHHALSSRGHDVEVVTVAGIGSELDVSLDAYARCIELDLSRFDLVVSSDRPAWAVAHERHVVYSDGASLAHQAPSMAELSHLDSIAQPSSLIEALREINHTESAALAGLNRAHVHALLLQFLDRCVVRGTTISCLATPSEFSAQRFEAAGWVHPIMVAPPVTVGERWQGLLPPRTLCVAESSFERDDRVPMLIDAFATIEDPHAELRIIGDGPHRVDLEQATHDRRVHFLGRLDRETRHRELSESAVAVVVEKDVGWSVMGADSMTAGTPLVAPRDAGGVTELVEHGVNGVLVEPSADGISWGVRHVVSSGLLRWRLGLQARRRLAELTVEPLLDQIEDLLSSHTRSQVLTLSTYPFDPMVSGGQRRGRFLHRALADVCDVTVLVNTSPTDVVRRRLVEPGLVQVEVPKSAEQIAAEADIFAALDGIPIDDLTAARLTAATPAFERELAEHVERCDLVIATQPFLLPSIPEISTKIVYDSQNVEAELKAAILPDSPGGRWLLDAAVQAERQACSRASFITACTEDDLAALSLVANLPAVPGLVVGNGVDSSALPFKTPDEHHRARLELLTMAGLDTDDERPIAVFVGSWHAPNIEAARLVLDLAARRADWLFVMAGSHTSEFADQATPANVHLIAVFAESMLWPLLAGGDIALNPMMSGGGSNLKLFDYLAVGTPIVASPVGARGLANAEDFADVAEPDVSAFSAAIDKARSEVQSAESIARRQAGRRLVESDFDWTSLGHQWAEAIIDNAALHRGHRRQRTRSNRRPVLSPTGPPPADRAMAAVRLVGQRARATQPSRQELSMDPRLRERLKQANDNRNIGRVLPDTARFTAPKKVLIRLGQAFTNEQVIYNKAIVEAVEQLAVSIQALETEQRELRRTLDEVSTENQVLAQRVEELE